MAQSLLKSINQDVGKAIHHYDMISHGDRIVVGVSGGKDSLTLLWLLTERLSRIPVTYELFPVYIDPGFSGGFAEELCQWVQTFGLNLRVEHTDYGIQAHRADNRENPCFLCARLRRKKIFDITGELGCNKIAFGHHKDDIIETFFLNICFSGMMATMRPKQSFFDGRFSIIRPLAFVDEQRIQRFARKNNFPEFANPCPYGKISKRKEIKDLLNHLYQTNQKIKGNIFRSLSNINHDYLL
ncbi:MAG: tRNA 2-thiocytidine(32) synthetase TtcA [Desulfobacteraceae bacterium]|nr:MAG: tRNA 2-thiocytidine(32) synthetase TtcA [Desulfobacteraceae bacterium]